MEKAQPRPRVMPKYIFGVGLTGLMGVLLLSAICELSTFRMVDFPCDMGLGPHPNVLADTRIAYCVSLWPRPSSSGGAVYAVGSSNQDQLIIDQGNSLVGTLTLVKQGQLLFINKQPLQPGRTYERFSWRLSLNPWLIRTARVSLMNTRSVGTSTSNPDAALIVTGDIHEGWLPGPLGLALLIAGLWLIKSA